MPVVYRPWVSPYDDEDFEWDPNKSLATFEDRDLVFEAARIIFAGRSVDRVEQMLPLPRIIPSPLAAADAALAPAAARR